jgi:hypothetical protein
LKSIITIFFLLLARMVHAQFGGVKAYDFLNVPAHARQAALGGVNVSQADRDINFIFNNPSLVGDTLSGYASAGYVFYIADIGQATFSYAHNFQKIGLVTVGIRHMNYGELEGYDASGMETGTFKSAETEIIVGKSRYVGSFRFGVNVKGVFSNFAGFRGSSILADLGGAFVHPHKQLVAGLVIRNFGFVLKEFSETSDTDLPFDVQVGTTFKPEHMPVRFSFTVYNLARMGNGYDDPAFENDGESTLNKIMQYVNLGVELLVHKNVNVLAGYNSLRQQELKNQNGSGAYGFTVGLSVHINQFEFVVSRASYSAGNAAYSFTLNANTKSILMKRKDI